MMMMIIMMMMMLIDDDDSSAKRSSLDIGQDDDDDDYDSPLQQGLRIDIGKDQIIIKMFFFHLCMVPYPKFGHPCRDFIYIKEQLKHYLSCIVRYFPVRRAEQNVLRLKRVYQLISYKLLVFKSPDITPSHIPPSPLVFCTSTPTPQTFYIVLLSLVTYKKTFFIFFSCKKIFCFQIAYSLSENRT